MRRTKDLEDSVKKTNKLMTFRAFSIGFSVAVLALACGSDSDNGGDEGGEPSVEPPRETCEDNPLLAGCDLPDQDINGDPIAPPEQPASDPGDNQDPDNEPSAEDLARAAAENVLASNCGQCHGPALTPQQASAGMNYINDIQKLADEGKIIPLNSAGSRVIERMREGSMPPVLGSGSGVRRGHQHRCSVHRQPALLAGRRAGRRRLQRPAVRLRHAVPGDRSGSAAPR
jgi:mono/diheme cytochrome c family protein